MSKFIENNNFKKVVLFVYDLITLIASYAFTILITFPVAEFTNRFIDNIYFGIINVVVSILLYVAFRLYNSLWRYASTSELVRVLISAVLVAVMNITIYLINQNTILPKEAIVFMFLQFGFAMIPRFGYRVLNYFKTFN